MKQLFRWVFLGLMLAGPAYAADVVSNATSGVRYPSLATAIAAATNGDTLVMIGNDTLQSTPVISNKTLTVVSDGNVRTIYGSTNCTDGMISVVGMEGTLILGQPGGDDNSPTLIFDGAQQQGVHSLSNMFFLELGWLTIHPGVVLRNLDSVDAGAIYSIAGVVEMLGGSIESNAAPYGAGILNDKGEVRLYGGRIIGNEAQIGGGGIYSDGAEWMWNIIVGYMGKVEMTSGLIADNSANFGGGVFLYGAMDFMGGQIVRNTASQGGGLLYANGSTNFGLTVGGNAVMASNTAPQGSGIFNNNDGYAWLTWQGGGKVVPPNDVFMAHGLNPIVLAGPLSGRGPAAQLTPAIYEANQWMLAAATTNDLWVVSNYYGKFTVTPAPGDPDPWYVNVNGRLSRDNSAATPATILSIASSETNVEWGVEPAFQAWDGVVELATNLVGQAWNFQPLAPEAYSVTNGRVVVPRDRPLGIYRLRTGGAGP